MKKRILILSGIQLSTNPRVVKEADTLADAGYDVEVAGATLVASLQHRDEEIHRGRSWKYTTLVDAASSRFDRRLQWLGARARFRFWNEIGARTGMTNARQFGYVFPELLRIALDHPADLIILHNPQSLWVGAELARRGRRLAVDMEDWYSADLPGIELEDRRAAALTRKEQFVLSKAAYASAPSRAMSAAIAEAYGCNPPEVIYNAFPLHDRARIDGDTRDRRDPNLISICWFSQVVGPGRGLEQLIDAVATIATPVEIHLRGNTSIEYRASLLARVNSAARERIFFHQQVSANELLSRIAEHDIGIASELRVPRSRDVTITNKILEYLLAGVAVVASDTAGQREVAANAGSAVTLFRAGDSVDLSEKLSSLISDAATLRTARNDSIRAAESTYSWEHCAPVLLTAVKKALRTA